MHKVLTRGALGAFVLGALALAGCDTAQDPAVSVAPQASEVNGAVIPGRFIVVSGGKASVFAETRPELAGYGFAPTEPFRLRARDGLPLLGYVNSALDMRERGIVVTALAVALIGYGLVSIVLGLRRPRARTRTRGRHAA